MKNLGYKLLFIYVFSFSLGFTQTQDSIYKSFKDSEGNVQSEGYIKNGEPVGYWKSYYSNGNLKSEGNRKDGELNGLWKFYNKSGIIVEAITYKNGLKDGNNVTFGADSVVLRLQTFHQNVLQDTAYYFDLNGVLKKWIVFIDGQPEGISIHFANDGRPVAKDIYSKGKKINKIEFNSKDVSGKKQGLWLRFNDDWKIVYEVTYLNGLKHGYERIFSEDGTLKEINKYQNGKLIKESNETQTIDLKTEFGPNNTKSLGGYNTEGQKEGVHQLYNNEGKPIKSELYDDDKIVAKGLITASGIREGYWELFYEDGHLKATGNYKNNKKVGKWLYYYSGDTSLQHIANYGSNGKANGLWLWFYESGDTLSIMNYENDNLEGDYLQFDMEGRIVVKGQYSDDMKVGHWKYIVGTEITRGNYIDDYQEGLWTTRDTLTNTILFKGSYSNDLPVGFHKYSYKNGKPKKFGSYNAGERNGTWKYFKISGELKLTITYDQGIEVSFNDYSITPRNTYKADFEK